MSEDNFLMLINLPDVVLETILSNLTYDEIAKNRLVCKQFNQICKKLLNRGFNLMEKYHAQCLRSVKSQLPRRESERRSHSLARHCDILTAIETRISMLSMTFTKYIDLNLCCFIPGKVIDEIFRVLRLIRISKTPPRTPEILQELRDISSMAMEHFDEKILPELKQSICSSVTSVNAYDLPTGSLMISHHSAHPKVTTLQTTSFTTDRLNTTFKKIYSKTKKNKMSVLCVKGQIGKLKLRLNRQSFQMRLQNLKLQEHAKKIQEQDVQLAEIRKHLEDWEQKLSDLSAEQSRAREECQKVDGIDARKRKHTDVGESCESSLLKSKDLQAKKRKLIIERKPSIDAHEEKFKKFLSNLLGDTSTDVSTSAPP